MNIVLKILLIVLSSSELLYAQRNFSPLDDLINEGINQRIFPGAVALIYHRGSTIYHRAFGHHTFDAESPFVTKQTIFDLASLTKVIATTTAAMILHDRNMLSLNDSVGIKHTNDVPVLIKHLLTHTSGILDDKPTKEHPLKYAHTQLPGTNYIYSDINMILLQKVIEQIAGIPLDMYVLNFITQPLRMNNTFFKPVDKSRCMPTRDEPFTQGIVHDPRARILGGVCGHAGLFSTASDLKKFMKMIMNYGRYKENNQTKQLINPVTVAEWTHRQCPFDRGYGWHIGQHLSNNAFGHYGWTGTSIWADKSLQLFCILLTNRSFPDDHDLQSIRAFRIRFHELIMEILAA